MHKSKKGHLLFRLSCPPDSPKHVPGCWQALEASCCACGLSLGNRVEDFGPSPRRWWGRALWHADLSCLSSLGWGWGEGRSPVWCILLIWSSGDWWCECSTGLWGSNPLLKRCDEPFPFSWDRTSSHAQMEKSWESLGYSFVDRLIFRFSIVKRVCLLLGDDSCFIMVNN